MKRSFTFIIGFLLLFLAGCGYSQYDNTRTDLTQNVLLENDSSDFPGAYVDEMLAESYLWRRAYAEFLWDRDLFHAELEKQFTNLSDANYEYYTPELGLLFLDSDDVPELLVYYQCEAPPAPEYCVIYHYAPASKEDNSSVEVYYSGFCGNGTITWKYLPHGNAFYTGYYKCMGGLYDYNLFFLENGEWVNWDDMPVIMSRMIAESYGVFDSELINIHDVEPMLSDDWRSPVLRDNWTSLYHGSEHHSTIAAVFGDDAVAGLPEDFD